MKKYFKNSLKRAVFAPWGLPLGTPEAPPGCTYIELPAPVGSGWGENKGPAFQFQKLIAVEEAVNKERQGYQDKIRADSSRNYCVVCEKEVVAGQALRCPSCGASGATSSATGVHSEGNEADGLLPDGFNPNRPPSEPEEGSAPGAAASVPACEGEDPGVRNSQEGGGGETSLIHEFGAGVEVGGEEEPDERPAVWCHHKNCKNDADAKGLLICTKCQRGFHAGCCEPPLNFEMVTRFLWQCADCKMCEVCLSNENEETMLICDACDRAFHMECLSPPVQEVPEGDWFCKGCGYCSSCAGQLTEDEALDPSCFYSNRHRICVACKEKYLRVKRGRSPYRSNTAFDSVYAACSKRNNPNKLCEVCAAPLESDSKGPQKRIVCAVCRIGVHAECSVARQAPDEYICKICSDFIEDFQAETDRSTAAHARHPTLMALENVAT